jgi:hypothetical protein
MSIDPERLETIHANAELVVRELAHASGRQFGYDSDSVAWVEEFIERQRAEVPETARGLVSVLGCYLGEAIIEAVPGAEWVEDDNGALAVLFMTGDRAYPFNKVDKQIAEGLESGESILSFYNMSVKFVAAGKLAQTADGKAPWRTR